MNIKEQVLSINQVKELQELGFDVNKYASMCWIKYTSDEEPYEETYNLTILDENCYEMTCLAPIPTLSIGDIMDILPNVIKTTRFSYMIGIANPSVYYIDRVISKGVYFLKKNFFIDNLFEALKWCIINKHI